MTKQLRVLAAFPKDLSGCSSQHALLMAYFSVALSGLHGHPYPHDAHIRSCAHRHAQIINTFLKINSTVNFKTF